MLGGMAGNTGVLPLLFQLCVTGQEQQTSPADPFANQMQTWSGKQPPKMPSPPVNDFVTMLGDPYIPPVAMLYLMMPQIPTHQSSSYQFSAAIPSHQRHSGRAGRFRLAASDPKPDTT